MPDLSVSLVNNSYSSSSAGAAGVAAGSTGYAARAATKVGAAPEVQSDKEIMAMKRAGRIECETCKNRKYQDGSDDPGVSFKAPGHISPGSAASVIMSHEQEHVTRERANAEKDGREVLSQSVSLSYSTCAECGRTYASGGLTKTTTANKSSDSFEKQYQNTIQKHFGGSIDTWV